MSKRIKRQMATSTIVGRQHCVPSELSESSACLFCVFFTCGNEPRLCPATLVLLFDCLDTLPSTAQPLLPQADPVVSSADSEHVTTQTPAHAPGDGIDIEDGGFPVIYNMSAVDPHKLQV
jgi:hypothetical protein